jgi:NAD-dependent DNA ligase
MEERRKHQRFRLQDSCFVNHSDVVGTILDISMGGLSCTCLDQRFCEKDSLQQVDIYCRKRGMWVEELKIKILESETVPGMFDDEFGVRKCRTQFVELAEAQAGQLEDLILQSVLPA